MANSSLTLSAGAVNTYQDGINVISNNLANAGSTGFKSQTLEFQDQVYQTIFAPSAPSASSGGTDPIESGLGVKISSRHTDFEEGAINTTGVNTDLAINGDGFFILGTLDGSQAPTYTRNGSFTLNQNGVLIDPSSGKTVQGYTADAAGKLPTAGSTPGTVTIPIGLTTTATGTGFGVRSGPTSADSVFDITQGGNLDVTQWGAEETSVASGGPTGVGTPQPLTTTVYDSLGTPHKMTVTYTPDATGATAAASGLPATVLSPTGTATVPASRWKVTVSFADGTQISGQSGTSSASDVIGYAYFDANGQFINTSSVTNPAGTFADVHQSGAATSLASGDLINVTKWPGGNTATSPTATASVAAPGAIGISFATLTSLAGVGEPVTTVSQNGFSQGTLAGFSVGNDGTITGSFSNGQQKTLGAIVVATFENLQGLSSVGSGQYAPTAASGLPQLGIPTNGRFGNIVDNALEQSNVSIATEFTKLIITQSAYLSNTKAITISNQDLQAVDNLIA